MPDPSRERPPRRKRDDERQKIAAEREHPEEGDAGHVDAELVREGQQQHRGQRRQGDPHDGTRPACVYDLGLAARPFRPPEGHRRGRGPAGNKGRNGATRDKCAETPRPGHRLLVAPQQRFHHEGIAQQRQQGADIAEGVEHVRGPPGVRAGEPGLHEGAGCRHGEIGQAQGREQQEEDPRNRLDSGTGLEVQGGHDGQEGQGGAQDEDMDHGLRCRAQARAEHMGVAVPQQQHGLEKDHHHRPHAGIPSEPGQDVPADEGLDLKQEKGAQENGQREYDTHAREPGAAQGGPCAAQSDVFS